MSAVVGRRGRRDGVRAGRAVGEAADNRGQPWFTRVAARSAHAVGTPWAFLVAAGTICAWAISGPLFAFSDTWQLVINTGTTIVTFLMVFLIQNTQNRDARALHLKLDELLRAVHNARTAIIDVEHESDAEMDRLGEELQALRKEAAPAKAADSPGAGTPSRAA